MRLNYYDKETLERIKNTIAADCSRHYDIVQLAQMAGMSTTRLKVAFKKQYGITLYKFLIQQRMQLARQLIEEDKKSLAEIAKSTGFHHVSNFTAAFKKYYGHTPGHYR